MDTSRRDGIAWQVTAQVDKFTGPEADERARRAAVLPPGVDLSGMAPELVPDDTVTVDGNLLVTVGLNRITSLIIGAGGQALTNTATRIGVGDSATAALIADTDLNGAAGASHRQFEVMAATYPTQSNGVMTFRSVFTTGEANFAWAEWGIDVGTPTVAAGTTVNTLVNHKVISLGTKTSSAAWTFTTTVTLA